MSLQVTTWSPNTCGCVISYQWDDTVPQASRTHKFVSVDHTKCVSVHPAVVLGTTVEGSAFTADHITKSAAIQAAAAAALSA
jgi:hypothetical protein